MTEKLSMNRVPALDGLRGIAILLVMASHFILAPAVDAPVLDEILTVGWIGVDLFFVLSGFLITGILVDGERRSTGLIRFYLRRAVRILPLYYVMALIAFVIVPRVGVWPGDDAARLVSPGSGEVWYWIVFPNVVIGVPGAIQSKIMAVSWSVAIEEHFYLLWPLVLPLLRPRHRLPFALIVLLGSTALRCALLLAHAADPGRLYMLTPTHLDGIAAGCVVALAVRRYADWRGLYRAGLAAGVVGGGMLAVLVLVGRGTAFDGRWMCALGYFAAAIGFAGTVVVAWSRSGDGSWRDRALSNGFLRVFGKYSYCLYFINVTIQMIVRRNVLTYEMTKRLPGGILVGQFAFFAVTTALCLLVAMISWRLIEKPFLSLVPGHAAVRSVVP